MLARALFLLLLAMNIGAVGWLYFAPQTHAPAFAASDPGVKRLVLLSERERPGEANAAELAAARQLSSKGVRDYYVVTAGDQQNTISLGLFHDQTNAEKRRNEIAQLGFHPEMVARTEELPVYWVDFAQDSHNPVNWRSRVTSQPDLRQQTVQCF